MEKAGVNPSIDRQIELAQLRSHELHLRHIYGLRWGGLALSAMTIAIGSVMIFMGLQGSFNWAVDSPHTIGAKLTNASPGVVFATVGLILGFLVIIQQPVNYETGAYRLGRPSMSERIRNSILGR